MKETRIFHISKKIKKKYNKKWLNDLEIYLQCPDYPN